MTKQQKIDLIRAKCIEANPEKEWRLPHFGGHHDTPIRLADVLWLLEERKIAKQIGFDKIGDFALHIWNLREDNLEQQSDECLQFLWNLLK